MDKLANCVPFISDSSFSGCLALVTGAGEYIVKNLAERVEYVYNGIESVCVEDSVGMREQLCAGTLSALVTSAVVVPVAVANACLKRMGLSNRMAAAAICTTGIALLVGSAVI